MVLHTWLLPPAALSRLLEPDSRDAPMRERDGALQRREKIKRTHDRENNHGAGDIPDRRDILQGNCTKRTLHCQMHPALACGLRSA